MEAKHRTARALVDRLRRATAAADALQDIRLLSKHDAEIRTSLADAGAIPLLAGHLLASADTSSQEHAAAALLNLSLSSPESLMSTPSLIPALAAALRPPFAPAASQHVAAAIFSLLATESYRPIIGSHRAILSALIDLVRSPSSTTRSRKDAIKALFGISLYPMNRAAMVEMGAAAALFGVVVGDGRRGMVEDATAVIAQLAGCGESMEEFKRYAWVRVLVDLLEEGSERARENAAAALLNLARSGGEEAVEEIAEVEMAEEKVRELAEKGSARGRSKAGELLKLMRDGRRGRWRKLVEPRDLCIRRRQVLF